MTGDTNPLDMLFAGSPRDCLVSRRPDGILNIFDPVIAAQVEAANTEALCVGDSLFDLFKPRTARARLPWTEVRAVLIDQNRRLTKPHHVEALHERIRKFLLDHVGQEQDLTWLIGRAVAFALIPQIVDGLSQTDLKHVETDQQARVGKFLKPQAAAGGGRLTNFISLQRATYVISKQIRRRMEGAAPARDDFLQSLLPFTEQLGIRRVTYLVTTLLSAASVAPEASACCLVYAMHSHPEWKARIALEMAAIEPHELHSLPLKKLPSTLRFIKEATRIWPFPVAVQRFAARDIDVDGASLRKGDAYNVSAYALHHLEEYWHDPESFDPDRWLSPRKPATRGTYVPFGFAPRSCVGAGVAQALLFLVCELFTRTFTVEMSPRAFPRLRMDGIPLPVDMVGTLRCASEPSA